MIVIGLGAGRTGSASLAQLIDAQDAAACFHELNPSSSVFSGNPQAALNTIDEFQRILEGGDRRFLAIDYSRPASVAGYRKLQTAGALRILGDVAFYYLSYVEDILQHNSAVRFVCIKRDRASTVASWIRKSTIRRWPSRWLADRLNSLITRTPFHTAYNHWQEHDGSRWRPDPVWDSCFPKFDVGSKAQAITRYWDMYYAEADRLAARYSDAFRIFPIDSLNDSAGQADILAHIGVPAAMMRVGEPIHRHRGSAPASD